MRQNREVLMSDEMVDFLYNGMTDESAVFNREEWLTAERFSERCGATEDDCEEFTRGSLDMMPDESDHEGGSPLRFCNPAEGRAAYLALIKQHARLL